VGVWQKSNQTARELPENLPVVVSSPTVAASKPSSAGQGQKGTLRVGNYTEHPIRLVLLLRQKGQPSTEPLSWDFAPGEGGKDGLQLSMPKAPVYIKQGDVIMAFATDGSRTYWGPTVVGETNTLAWQRDRQEWNLIIQN